MDDSSIPADEDYRIESLLDIRTLQTMADQLYAGGGIPVGILAPDGRILVAAGWQEVCTKYHRAHPEAAKRCKESDDYIKERLGETGPVAYKCKNRLWDIALPFLIEGRHVATLFVGQFFYDDELVDVESFKAQAAEFGFDWPSYERAIRVVPRFSRARVGHMLDYYRNLVAELAAQGLAILRLRRAEARLEGALREKEILIKEINHRVKNNLNVIVSLLGLQIEGEEDPRLVEALCSSQGRVFAISLIYELLYKQESLARIDLDAYLRSLASQLQDLYARSGLVVRLDIDTPGILLDVGRAVTCGLVSGELLTNAYKHAFAGRAEGSLEAKAVAEGGRLEIVIRDDGVGAPAAAWESSFGLSLARSLVEAQLGGELHLESGPEGTTCSFSFPYGPADPPDPAP